MKRFNAAMRGATTLEVIVALILFALAMAGLAIVIPMAYERSSLWQDQLNLASYLEQRLEANRVYTFEQLPYGDTGNLLDGNFIYRINTIYAVPGTDGGNPSWVLSNSTTGDGLWATYYDWTTGTTSSRLDSQINYNWGVTSPIPGTIGTDNFQVVWLGHVEAPVSGTYTFYAWADDAVRLWVNNTLVIDYWQSGTAGERSGTIALTAGTRYPIKMEFYEYQNNARAELRWASLPALAYGLVPQNRLYSSTAKRATITTAFNKSGSISLSTQLLAFQVWSGTIFSAAAPPTSTVMHVQAITMSKTVTGNRWIAQALVEVRDSNGNLLSGVRVDGNWSGLKSSSVFGVTGVTGQVTLTSPESRPPNWNSGTFTFTVTDLTRAGYSYDPAQNIVTSGSISHTF